MSTYFSYFQPLIKYNDRIVTDITKRAKIKDILKNNVYVFLPYTVQGNDRPEDVAYFYYGNVEYTWLIYMANDIIDPYYQWVMDQNTFERFLMKKYENASGVKGLSVLEWTQNTTINENIIYVQNINDPDLKISTETFIDGSNIVLSEWRPIRVYEYEEILNENKRHINLINNSYVDSFVNELSNIMRD